MNQWCDDQGVPYCKSTTSAAQAYVENRQPDDTANRDWKAPIFEYRVGVLDQDNADVCVSEFAALTSVFFAEGGNMPDQ